MDKNIKAVLDITVHAETFRNIDLFQQGLYCIQFSVSLEPENQEINQGLAVPYAQDIGVGRRKIRNNHPHALQNAMVDSTGQKFKSRIFLIRYCDELVEINDIAHFMLEIPLCWKKRPLVLVVDLLFTDPSNGDTRVQHPDRKLVSKLTLDVVSTVRLRINNALRGVNQFMPIVFDPTHFCVVNCLINAACIDFKLENGVQLCNRIGMYYEEEVDEEKELFKALFPGLIEGEQPIDPQYVNRIFEEIIGLLIFNYDLVKNGIKSYLENALREVRDQIKTKVPSQLEQYQSSVTFAERVNLQDPSEIVKVLTDEMVQLAGLLLFAYQELLGLTKYYPILIRRYKSAEFLKSMEKFHGDFIVKDTENDDTSSGTLEQRREDFALRIRGLQWMKKQLNTFQVHDIDYIDGMQTHPIVFEDISSSIAEHDIEFHYRPSVLPNSSRNRHLIVLVHGFQGNALDMRIIKSYIALTYPDSVILSSKCNENRTQGYIEDMGVNLSHEVQVFIYEWFHSGKPSKITFIGHSLGGLIIRAALPHLTNYKDIMHSFITLSTPHLGYIYSPSRLVDAGMWMIRSFTGTACLKQMMFEDYPKLRGCYLYHLSKSEGLNWFKNVVLVSSTQDKYVPYDSSRMQLSKRTPIEGDNGQFYKEMVDNLSTLLSNVKVIKLDVNFKLMGKVIDSLIGRSAHIEVLENPYFMRLLIYHYPDLFTQQNLIINVKASAQTLLLVYQIEYQVKRYEIFKHKHTQLKQLARCNLVYVQNGLLRIKQK